MITLVRLISGLTNREEGQTLTEYGLLLAFIAILAILAITFLGQEISTLFSDIAQSLSDA